MRCGSRRHRDSLRHIRRGDAQNPIRVLTPLSAACTTTTARITIPGFYDGCRILPSDILAQNGEAQSHGGGARITSNPIGRSIPAARRTGADRAGLFAPTCEINGIIGGRRGGLEDRHYGGSLG